MAEGAGEKPKIIIDEDWKSQVQREKEQLERQRAQEARERPAGESAAPPPQGAAYGTLPTATLPVLLTMLATQALAALGQFPHPLSGKPEVHLDEAKHYIDLLDLLQQKTAGNRTPEETQLLEDMLHELRLAFLTVQKQAAGGRGDPAP